MDAHNNRVLMYCGEYVGMGTVVIGQQSSNDWTWLADASLYHPFDLNVDSHGSSGYETI